MKQPFIKKKFHRNLFLNWKKNMQLKLMTLREKTHIQLNLMNPLYAIWAKLIIFSAIIVNCEMRNKFYLKKQGLICTVTLRGKKWYKIDLSWLTYTLYDWNWFTFRNLVLVGTKKQLFVKKIFTCYCTSRGIKWCPIDLWWLIHSILLKLICFY